MGSSLFSQSSSIWLEPNKGQWNEQINHRVKIPKGYFYVNKEGFYYSVSNFYDLTGHNHGQDINEHDHETYLEQNIKATFIGSDFSSFKEMDTSNSYYNYFLGDDESKWVSKVRYCQAVEYQNIYNGINLELYGLNSSLKYNLKLEQNANPDLIQIKYEGQDKLYLKDNSLKIKTKFGLIEELRPIAYYQESKKAIAVNFVLDKNVVSFEFPEGYDHTKAIIIDPEIVFSTFTGSISDNWGNTACPGTNGEAYAGGIVFGPNYPITPGVIQSNWNNGVSTGSTGLFDVAIVKFSSDGSNLLYSTFLGGSRNELPHSIITDEFNNLYIYGSTDSDDFPTSVNAYKTTRNPNVTAAATPSNLSFAQTDIFITILNENGTNIVASTYYGGSLWDGINTAQPFIINYGDQFKGEININSEGDVFVVGNTKSADLPMVTPIRSTIGGSDDGFIAKFNSNLSQLLFSSYIGGSGQETSYGIDFDSNNSIYVVGGTNSTDFMGSFGITPVNSYLGGRDGYIIKINNSSYQLENVRFISTPSYDQTFFVRTDIDDYIYIYGQSTGIFPIVNTTYVDPNSTQFIQKLSNDLNLLELSTVFGTGRPGLIDIAPTAFKVSDCFEILVAGYGGLQNTTSGLSAGVSTTTGLQVTSDAFQVGTTGSDFYIAKFGPNMINLKYATFMGALSLDSVGIGLDSLGNEIFVGNGSHVDGGTSRFDDNGEIYHAVCASCGQGLYNGFTITPNAYAPILGGTNTNCNMAVFKFKLLDISAAFSIPDGFSCFFDSIHFSNESVGSSYLIWDFGDGSTSTEFSPSYLYSEPGTYHVTLTIFDTTECLIIDSASVDLELWGFQGEVDEPGDTICPGDTIHLNAQYGILYQWEPANLVDDPFSSSPIATVNETTEFTVIVGDYCYQDTLSIWVGVDTVEYSISADTTICEGESAQLNSSGGGTYLWTPSASLDDAFLSNPIASPSISTEYFLEITSIFGCVSNDTVSVDVIPIPSSNPLPDSIGLCAGSSFSFNLQPGFNYLWGTDYYISSLDSNFVTINPLADTIYFVQIVNQCATVTDTVKVHIVEVIADVGLDTIICKSSSISVSAFGGQYYHWYPESYFDDYTSQNPIVTPPFPTEIWVEVADNNGCTDLDTMFINFFPTTFLHVSPDSYLLEGDTATIWAHATNPGQLFWTPPEFLECAICDTTLAFPPTNMTYVANFIDTNGCLIKDIVTIHFDPLLYVPNAFTPNGDGMNDFFGAKGGNFLTFELLIFNRWGELIFEADHIDDWWDGKYKGEKVQDGVYVWKIRYEDFNGNIKVVYGHVTSLR